MKFVNNFFLTNIFILVYLKIPYTGILEREEKPQLNMNAHKYEILKLCNELHKNNIPLKTNRLKSFQRTKRTLIVLNFKRPFGTMKNTSSCSSTSPSVLLSSLAFFWKSARLVIEALISTFSGILHGYSTHKLLCFPSQCSLR